MSGALAAPARAAARLGAALSLSLLGACASQGAPPGGPPDAKPPQLVRITPDTGAVNVRAPRAVFEFDEVVSERPQGAQSLEGLFVISPRDGEPDVSWKRDAITVRPRRGFRANTVYTITMLPGLADLRGNARKEGATAVFSTGATIPATAIRGVVFDWVRGEPAPRAIVEAVVPDTARPDTSARGRRRQARRDSVVYVTTADSSGRFSFAHLGPGPYVVRGIIDANNNRALDAREAWDSVRVSLADSARVELLAFVHDTTGPRIATITADDSVTLRVAFDNPLTPALPPDSATYVLRASDSTLVPIRFVRAARDTSMAMVLPYTPPGTPRPGAQPGANPPATPVTPGQPTPAVPAAPPPTRAPSSPLPTRKPARPPARAGRPASAAEMRAIADSAARADSIARVEARRDSIARANAPAEPAVPDSVLRARRDTTPPAPPRARPSRAAPITEVVLTLAKPLVPGTTYRLEVRGARGILGVERASDRTFTVPKAAPAAPRDSTARPNARTPVRRLDPTLPPARPDSTRRPPPGR